VVIRQPRGTSLVREIYLVHRRRSAALVTDMISVITHLHRSADPPRQRAANV